ncbi:hypothetical protein ACFWMG_44080 [Streptomyces sp. NPDC127074]|uniref:hypothetical protein n=1 Tax=Streptomyces sp. NPDC127074 TaxID=3347130 RepID=UPI0036629CA9
MRLSDDMVAADLYHLGYDDAAASGPADEVDADAVRAGLLDDAHVDRVVESLWPRLAPGDLVRTLLTERRLGGTPRRVYGQLGRVASVIEVPGARHHIMLDEPLALVAAIRTLLSDWAHSPPGAPGRSEW